MGLYTGALLLLNTFLLKLLFNMVSIVAIFGAHWLECIVKT